MIINIEIELGDEYEKMDVIAAFNYGMQIAEAKMKIMNLTVFAEIIKDIRNNDPLIHFKTK